MDKDAFKKLASGLGGILHNGAQLSQMASYAQLAATNVGGTKEAVLHDKTGIIIDKIDQLEEALRDLLSNKDKRLNFGKEAKKRALNEFMWDKITNEYMSLIKSF